MKFKLYIALALCIFFTQSCTDDVITQPKEEPTIQDKDGDTIPDDKDNCPNIANTDQKDENKNGIGDACEEEPQETFLETFEKHFFDKTWRLIDEEKNEIYFFLGVSSAEKTKVETVETPFSDPVTTNSFSYKVNPDNENQVILESSKLDQVFKYIDQKIEPPILVSSIDEKSVSILLSNNKIVVLTLKEEFSPCQDIDRLFQAKWLVANNDFTKEYLLRDSIRFISTRKILNQDLNIYGLIANPEFPEGTGTQDYNNFITMIDGCQQIYSTFPTDFMTEKEMPSPHLFSFQKFKIEENQLISTTVENKEIRFTILE